MPTTSGVPAPTDHTSPWRIQLMAVRKHVVSADGQRFMERLSPLYRMAAAVWLLYSVALLLVTLGSPLLAFAEPFRAVAVTLTSVTSVAMAVRLVSPGRPQWTRWTMPLIGTVAMSIFTLTLFASEMAGGITTSRAGFALLLLIPALGAYVSWISERTVRTL